MKHVTISRYVPVDPDNTVPDGLPVPPRPRVRADCVDGPRPCPWVSCRHHLYLDVKPNGSVVINHPDTELEDMAETCSLDVADHGPESLKSVGQLMNMVRERTLETLRYLEHGAHWAIFGLAGSMFANLIVEVPELVTGGIGFVFLVAAYYSSLRFRNPARS